MNQGNRRRAVRCTALLAVCALFLSLAVTAAPGAGQTETAWSRRVPGEEIPEGTTVAAQTDRWELALTRERYQPDEESPVSTLYGVRVTDRQTGCVYTSGVDPEYYGAELASKVLRDGLSKLFSVAVTNYSSIHETLHSSAAQTVLHYAQRPDGFVLYLYFPKREVGLTAEFTVDGSGLSVTVPRDGLVEEGQFAIVSIDVLPMFGAVRTGDDGDILFPDGSGAVYTIPKTPKAAALTSVDVYAPLDAEMDDLLESRDSGIGSAMLPVFGIRRGETAVFGAVTQGDAYARINLAPNTYMYDDLNRVYPSFRCRGTFRYTTTGDEEAAVTETEIRPGDLQVRYFFLSGEEADYSGMAACYRRYLLEQGQLRETAETVPTLAMTFLGGLETEGLLSRSTLTLSPFEEAEQVLQTWLDSGRTSLQVTYAGWQSRGYGVYPAHLPVSSALGGKSGLRSLSETLSRAGLRLLLSDNFLWRNEYGARSDGGVIYNYLQMPVTDTAQETFLLNQLGEADTIRKVRKLCRETGSALLFEDYGSLLYEDYSAKRAQTRTECMEQMARELAAAAEDGFTAVGGGNRYVLPSADFLTDIPMSSSGYFHLDYDVPFYQMVIHGSVAYTPILPGNMADNLQQEKLRWLEYGSVPFFLLTTRSERLKNSVWPYPFGTYYAEQEQTMREVYDEFAALSSVYRSAMVRHERLSETLRRITYADGSVLLLNYGAEAAEADGVAVGAEGWTLYS